MTDAERQSFRQAALGCRARGECGIVPPSPRPYTRSPEALQRMIDRRAERDRQVQETLARLERFKDADLVMQGYVKMYLRLDSHKIGAMAAFCQNHGLKRVEFARALRTFRLNSPFTRE